MTHIVSNPLQFSGQVLGGDLHLRDLYEFVEGDFDIEVGIEKWKDGVDVFLG